MTFVIASLLDVLSGARECSKAVRAARVPRELGVLHPSKCLFPDVDQRQRAAGLASSGSVSWFGAVSAGSRGRARSMGRQCGGVSSVLVRGRMLLSSCRTRSTANANTLLAPIILILVMGRCPNSCNFSEDLHDSIVLKWTPQRYKCFVKCILSSNFRLAFS